MRYTTTHNATEELQVAVEWMVTADGVLRLLASVQVSMVDPTLTAVQWRDLPITECIDASEHEIAQALRSPVELSPDELDSEEPPRRGRPANYPDAHYRAVARVMQRYRDAGIRRPIRSLAIASRVDRAEARQWVVIAVARGYLTPTP